MEYYNFRAINRGILDEVFGNLWKYWMPCSKYSQKTSVQRMIWIEKDSGFNFMWFQICGRALTFMVVVWRILFWSIVERWKKVGCHSGNASKYITFHFHSTLWASKITPGLIFWCCILLVVWLIRNRNLWGLPFNQRVFF